VIGADPRGERPAHEGADRAVSEHSQQFTTCLSRAALFVVIANVQPGAAMTTYLYSAIANGNSISFDPAVDDLSIDSGSLSAADFTLTPLANSSGVQWSNGSKTFTLTGVDLASLNQENVQFSDGSMLVNSCSANGFATDLSGTSRDDLLLGTSAAASVERITTSNSGKSEDWAAHMPDVSANGRYVVFSSTGANLGNGGDTNGIPDIFLKDLQTGALTRISTTSGGSQAVSDSWSGSVDPVVSANGRYVAFQSHATNLVGSDTNNNPDIFLKDVQTGALTRVSTSGTGAQANSESFGASISADGHLVAFTSYASNLVGSDTNGSGDVFVKNTTSGAVTLVSSAAGGTHGNGYSHGASISADGQYVMFTSNSTNLVAGDVDGIANLFVKNTLTGDVTCVTQGFAVSEYYTPSTMSADGRYVVFASNADVMHDGLDGENSIYRRDVQTGELNRVLGAGQGAYLGHDALATSGDGRYVVFTTLRPLVDSDTNNAEDVYVKDMLTGAVARASVGAHGEQAGHDSYDVAISTDGTTISFACESETLVGGPDYTSAQILVIDNPLAGWTLRGGTGDDVYQVSRPDTIVESAGEGTDTVKSSATYFLTDNVERLILTGHAAIDGYGNGEDNQITGNDAANTIAGRSGNDTLNGGAGNDTASYDDATSAVTVDLSVTSAQQTGGAGIDTLTNVENLVGSAHADHLTGSSSANTLDGGAGADTMTGAAGNDSYVVDDAGDSIVELADGGTDTIRSSINFTLAGQLENLVLTGTGDLDGTGNGAANSITGNSGQNVLNGGGGADTMSGGEGGDTYIVDSTQDVVIDNGVNDVFNTDTVRSSVSITLGANIENLTLTGSAANGTGNGWSNVITGNDAWNVLSGGGGGNDWDTLVGGGGNDTYIVDSAYDETIELANGGTDTVRANTSWGLKAETENLVLLGTGNWTSAGNDKNNVITGNSGNNTLNGAAGADTMSGGMG
jgi:Tol biopolymer transport system component